MEIIIKGLTKEYKRTKALDDISLTITSGIHGLLGPNGAGKTTLMRILATIQDADKGDISWKNYSWRHPKNVKGKIGYLPQNFGMYRFLTVEEALHNIAILKNIPPEQEQDQVNLAMKRTNLTSYSGRKVGQLSGGMLRRLGIAQAILGEPDFLILDEPSVGLDPTERIHFRKLVREYDNGQRLILISSHIVEDVESLCDTITIINHGKIKASGNLCSIKNMAVGKVYETIMPDNQFRTFETNNFITSFSHQGNQYLVRFIADRDCKGSLVTPTLEDSYTYIIQKDMHL